MKEITNIIRQYVRAEAFSNNPIQAKGIEEWFIVSHPQLWAEFSEEYALKGLNAEIRKVLSETRKWLKPGDMEESVQMVLEEIIEQICPPQTIRVMGDDGVATYFAFENATEEQIMADMAFSTEQIKQYQGRVKSLESLIDKRRELGVSASQSLIEFLSSK